MRPITYDTLVDKSSPVNVAILQQQHPLLLIHKSRMPEHHFMQLVNSPARITAKGDRNIGLPNELWDMVIQYISEDAKGEFGFALVKPLSVSVVYDSSVTIRYQDVHLDLHEVIVENDHVEEHHDFGSERYSRAINGGLASYEPDLESDEEEDIQEDDRRWRVEVMMSKKNRESLRKILMDPDAPRSRLLTEIVSVEPPLNRHDLPTTGTAIISKWDRVSRYPLLYSELIARDIIVYLHDAHCHTCHDERFDEDHERRPCPVCMGDDFRAEMEPLRLAARRLNVEDQRAYLIRLVERLKESGYKVSKRILLEDLFPRLFTLDESDQLHDPTKTDPHGFDEIVDGVVLAKNHDPRFDYDSDISLGYDSEGYQLYDSEEYDLDEYDSDGYHVGVLEG